jgi:hypothetical protein
LNEFLRDKEDLIQRLDSKSPLAEFFDLVCDFAFNVLDSSIIDTLVKSIVKVPLLFGENISEIVVSFVKHNGKLMNNSPPILNTLCDYLHEFTTKSSTSSKMLDNFFTIINSAAPFSRNMQTNRALISKLLDSVNTHMDNEALHKVGNCLQNIGLYSSEDLEEVINYVSRCTGPQFLVKSFPEIEKDLSVILALVR